MPRGNPLVTQALEKLTPVPAREIVDALLARVGKRLVVGAPLGLGKGNLVLNELYRRALADASIELTINTALTLETPRAGSDLEARFLEPLVARLFAGYPELEYAQARRRGDLPANVRIHEFFLTPGKFLGVASAQQDYISSNYTHAARDMLARGVNVIVQMISPGTGAYADRFSLSCNPDVTLDLVPAMRALGAPCAVVGEINSQLPFMCGDAVVEGSFFDMLCAVPGGGYTLFGTPKTAVSTADHAIGLYASALIHDGGTLQVGIGSMGDAVVNAMLLRHTDNARWQAVLGQRLDAPTRKLIDSIGGMAPFEHGLYGATEMLVDGFLHLFDHGILRRRVYDDYALQTLLNRGDLEARPSVAMLEALVTAGKIDRHLRAADLAYLQHWGIVSEDVTLNAQRIVLGDGRDAANDVLDAATQRLLREGGLGPQLRNGVVAHGGFFLGPVAFYERLRQLTAEERSLFNMTSVGRINQLYGGEALDQLQRVHARFVNSCLMVTLTGAVVSDTLADGRVLSGVGGQYNFVSMAHAVSGGRSIIKLRATREDNGKTTSNVVLNYPQTTIPRHLRDIVVTEYGIADLRGRSDAECIAAMLNICDSRFQAQLLDQAKSHGKMPGDYRIPQQYQRNTPQAIGDWLATPDLAAAFAPFPLGTDFTADELALGKALRRLQTAMQRPGTRVRAIVAALVNGRPTQASAPLLARMQLAQPRTWRERLYQRLLAWALS